MIAPHFVIFDPQPYVLGLLMTRLHTVWITAVCGQLETRIRYSNTLGYNTFPVPELSSNQKQSIEDCVWRVIEERESNPGKTMAELYGPKTMPRSLLMAHQDLDLTVETIYRGRAFKSDAERLEHLFKLYVSKVGDLKEAKGRAA